MCRVLSLPAISGKLKLNGANRLMNVKPHVTVITAKTKIRLLNGLNERYNEIPVRLPVPVIP